MKETIKNKGINKVRINSYFVIMELTHSNLSNSCKNWSQMDTHKGFKSGKIMINQLVYSIDLQQIKINQNNKIVYIKIRQGKMKIRIRYQQINMKDKYLNNNLKS